MAGLEIEVILKKLTQARMEAAAKRSAEAGKKNKEKPEAEKQGDGKKVRKQAAVSEAQDRVERAVVRTRLTQELQKIDDPKELAAAMVKAAETPGKTNVTPEDAAVTVLYLGADAKTPEDDQYYAKLFRQAVELDRAQQQKIVVESAQTLRIAVDEQFVDSARARQVVEAAAQQLEPEASLDLATTYAEAAPLPQILPKGKEGVDERPKEDRVIALDRRAAELLKQLPENLTPEESSYIKRALADMRHATMQGSASGMKSALESIEIWINKAQARIGEQVISGRDKMSYSVAVEAVVDSDQPPLVQKQVEEVLKPWELAHEPIKGGTGAPAPAAPARPEPPKPPIGLFTEDEIDVFPERLARKMRGLNVIVEANPNRVEDQKWLDDALRQIEDTTQTLTPDQAAKIMGVSRQDLNMDDPRVREISPATAHEVIERILQRRDQLVLRTPEASQQHLDKMKALRRAIGANQTVLRDIRQRFIEQEASGGAAMPDIVSSLLKDFDLLVQGGEEVVTGSEADPLSGELVPTTGFQPLTLEQRRELLEQIKQKLQGIDTTTLPEKNRLGDLREILKQLQLLESQDGRMQYDRLKEAGLNDTQKTWFETIASPYDFIELLDEAVRKGTLDEFMHHVETNTKDVATQFLNAVDTDDTQFMGQLFNQLIHEPQYANLVTNLQTLINKLTEREITTKQILRVRHKIWDRKSRSYIDDPRGSAEGIKVTDYLRHIQNWVREEKNTKRLTHDGYVLHLTHNFEYFSKMANTIEMGAMDALFAEEGNMLDTALSAYVGFAQKEHGMNYWKAPPGVFTRNEFGIIPADQHVHDVLRQQFTKEELPEKDLRRLVTLARGIAHVMTGEVQDLVLSSNAPRADAHGTSLTEQYGNIALNPLLTMERFEMDVPFLSHIYLFNKIGKKSTFGRYRHIPTEIKEAEKLYESRKQKARSRFFRFEEFDKEGVCIMDSFEGLFQTGYWGNRGWRWRGEQAFMHLYVKTGAETIGSYNPELHKPKGYQDLDHPPNAGQLDFKKTIQNLAVAHPQAASSIMEMWHARGYIDRAQLSQLRQIVWERLRDVAPQAFVVLERDMLQHNTLKEWLAISLKSEVVVGGKKLTGEEALSQVIMDAETITRNVLNRTTAGRAPTLADLHTAEDWLNALIPNKDVQTAEFAERAGLARKFMETLKNGGAVSDMIQGNRSGWSGTDYEKQVTALKNISFARSMPAHYRSFVREASFEATGGRTIGRMVGDNDTIAEKAKEIIWGELKEAVQQMQADPAKIKDAKYAPIAAIIRKYCDAIQAVHGTESKEDKIATVYHAGYILNSAFANWFNKGTLSRYLGISVDPRLGDISSWVNRFVGKPESEMDASEVRTLLNQSIGLNTIAPYHGGGVEIKTIGIGPFKTEISIPVFTKTKIGPFSIPTGFKRTPYNAYRFSEEHGATRTHLFIDMARSYAGIILVLALITALQQAFKDQEEK